VWTVAYSTYIGARVKRKEDPRLITGSSAYVDDIKLAGLLHVVLVRSPYAHATLGAIDVSAAASAPGVVKVYTGADLQRIARPIPGEGGGEGGAATENPGIVRHALATDRVRFLGEPVAAIVAETVEAGRDAADLVTVEYTELPVVVDLEATVADGAPLLHDSVPNNVFVTWTKSVGDIEAAFNDADTIVKQRIISQRVAPVSMEVRGGVAQVDPFTGGLVYWGSSQAPHLWRTQLAKSTGLAENQIRVIAPEVGGGFGAKINAYQEDFLLATLALDLKRPVKWVETRSENLMGMSHGRAQIADMELSAKRDGTVTGLRMRVLADLGAYPRDSAVPSLTGWLAVGVYHIPNFDAEIRSVFTNTNSVAAYRGAGRPEAAYYIERMMDLLAAELKLDPTEVRRKNYIPPDAFPYQTPGGVSYDSGEYAKNLDYAMEVSGYQRMRAEQAQLRAQGRVVGIGVATYTEICGFGPYESAQVRVEPTGTVTVFTGTSPHGQGTETSFAQIVADRMGVPFDDIVVQHGDTGNTPMGVGTMGSRGLVVGGSALVMAIDVVMAKARKIAAAMLEVAEEDITIQQGQFQVKGAPGRSLTLKQVAEKAYGGDALPDNMSPGLDATDFFRPPDTTYPFGTHVSMVEIDRDTGTPTVLRYYSIDDCGNVISPLLVDGQVHGGLTQGIAQALYEEVVYDEQGQLLTGSLMDYVMPKAWQLPTYHLDRTVTTSPRNPLGAKGIGEAATIGSTPCIANAVMDALAPFGVTHLDLPLRPEKVWRAIQGA
jgi:aerobic carbon-monoxide dehydrogenase large subunit